MGKEAKGTEGKDSQKEGIHSDPRLRVLTGICSPHSLILVQLETFCMINKRPNCLLLLYYDAIKSCMHTVCECSYLTC